VSVCIPCKDEAATIGHLVGTIRAHLMECTGLVDELIVVDDRSADATAAIASRAGANVVAIDDIHERHGPGAGKGNVLWASLIASRGDVVVWCDGDVTSFRPNWVTRLVAPLLDDADLALVKASYRRPTDEGGGGRTTELVARPLLSLYASELAGLDQPLAGEMAGRRDVLETIPFVQGWGVEIGILLDVARQRGAGAIGQVDLGERRHRHRPLSELSVQAAEVMGTLLARVGALVPPPGDQVLRLADGSIARLNLAERAPVAGQRQPM
jgi:glucosyl-3-phosphoglycerate synthase